MNMETLIARCSSPMEVAFLRAFRDIADEWDVSTEMGEDCLWVVVGNVETTIVPAFAVVAGGLAYKLDFVVGGLPCPPQVHRPSMSLAVEIDGHEWHERTKEQAARDRQRDRALLSAAIATIRFTGAEVYACAEQCARETVHIANSLQGLDQAIWSSGWETHELRTERLMVSLRAVESEEDRLP